MELLQSPCSACQADTIQLLVGGEDSLFCCDHLLLTDWVGWVSNEAHATGCIPADNVSGSVRAYGVPAEANFRSGLIAASRLPICCKTSLHNKIDRGSYGTVAYERPSQFRRNLSMLSEHAYVSSSLQYHLELYRAASRLESILPCAADRKGEKNEHEACRPELQQMLADGLHTL